MCKKIIFYILLFSLSVVTGCIGENPNLLNPPPQTSSMNVRFVNLCKDEPALRLLMNNTVQSGLTPYATCSDTVHPPADSVVASVTLDGTEKYKRKNKVRFLYKTYYSLIALPSAPGDSIQRTVDTIISIGTISSFTNRFNTAYVKVMNALPDTTYRFSVVLGCPNGNSIVQSLRYRGIGPAIELPAGDEAISVLTERAGSAPDINLYRLQFKAGGQYTIIIYGISSGKPDLLLLDEFGGINALSNINSIPSDEKYAKVRTINFSNQQVTVKKKSNPDEIISDNVQSGFISSYSNIEACSSQNNDTIGASVGNDEKSKADASLEVLKNFTVAVFDSVDNPAKLTVIVPPFRLSQPLDGNSVVRVINASVNYPGYTLSLGARDYKNSPSKFISGELISPAIQYGELSKHVVISSGIVPLAVYSTEDPSRLIYNSLADFKADKSYLIFILDDPTNNGKIKISLVEENDVNKSAEFLTEGSFTQVVNLIPDVETVIVAVPPALNQAKIYFSDLLATIMNPGSGDITISGSLLNINNDITKRNLIIATGASQNKELLLFQYTPLKIESVNYKRRFINACKEFSTVNVALNVDTMLIAENISYGSASSVENVTLERTTSFLFINPVDSTVIRRIDGLNLPFGKNFTFILGGNKTSGYTIVQVQEY